MRQTRRSTKPQRTAEQARTFETESIRSIEQVEAAIEARREEGIHEGCECIPYEDTFTFNRWRDQKMQVSKGEKALTISTFAKTGGTFKAEDANGQEKEMARLRPVAAKLFCRCQVKPVEEKAAVPA